MPELHNSVEALLVKEGHGTATVYCCGGMLVTPMQGYVQRELAPCAQLYRAHGDCCLGVAADLYVVRKSNSLH